MAGKFINSNQTSESIIKSGVDIVKGILNGPFYAYSEKKAALSDYYNINTNRSTLDEAAGTNYSDVGKDLSLRFNKIKNFYLYGIDRINIDLDLTEFGLQGSDISGEAVILPNTIIPYPGDFFKLYQIDKPYYFRVTKVTPNTIDTGSTLYKINYVLAYTSEINLDDQVIEEYQMLINNVGSNYKAIITSSQYDLVSQLEHYATILKDNFSGLFYDQKVQTFVCRHNNIYNIYDPYLIEFIRRNNILSGSSQYIYVSQQMFLPATFEMEYRKTFFSTIEEKDKDNPYVKYVGNALLCNQRLSLLYAYPEDYYYMDYSNLNRNFYSISMFEDLDIMYYIRNNIITGNIFYDIIIHYFNGTELSFEDLQKLKRTDYHNCKEYYYSIPFAIYCLDRISEETLK